MQDDGSLAQSPFKSEPRPEIGSTRTSPNVPVACPSAHTGSRTSRSTVRRAVGGSITEVKYPSGDRPQVGGGVRGEIREYTPATRRRFLNFLNSIPKNIPNPLFITLTYPDNFPIDRAIWKRDLKVWAERLMRKLDRKVPAVWRLEFQDRKSGENAGRIAPHFHVLLFADNLDLGEFRVWLARSWYEVCGEISRDHLAAGTSCTPMRSRGGMMVYAAKYMAKPEQLKEEIPSTGKLWGKLNEKAFGIQFEETSIPLKESFQMRRALRRKQNLPSKGSVSTFTVYTPYEATEQLLEYYFWEEYRGLVGKLLMLRGYYRT